MAADVVVYTLGGCVHCRRARALLGRRGIAYEEVRGDGDPGFRRRLYELTGRLSVPQILVRGEPIGGASDLARLDRAGVLNARVVGLPFPRRVVRHRLSMGRTARWLALSLLGGQCSPWRYDVELVDRDGCVHERLEAASEGEALALADAG